MRRTVGKQTPQEFVAGTLPVVHILKEYFPPHEDGSRMPLQVAVFDISSRPDLDLQNLTRLIASETEGEGDTEFAWDCCVTRKDLLIRLTCAYQTPVEVQFALLFRYSRQRDYVRWVVEHGNTVPIADVSWSEQLALEHPLCLCPPDKDLASRLRLLRLHQQMTKEQRTTLTEPEIASILFEVKRVASYGELARFAEEALHIRVSGTESEYFPNAFAGPEASLQVQQLSRDFHRFLIHVMLVPGLTAGYANETVYFFTEDWRSEHPTDLLKPA